MFNIYIDMNKSDVVLLLTEKWTNKYKKSIDCSHPKGFSQKAHCKARKLRKAGVKTKSKPVKESMEDRRKQIQNAIDKLEKEYDRLDSTGQDTTQITKQLKMLRDKLPVSVEKGKELFAKMKQSLT
jgi:uncharacterized protein